MRSVETALRRGVLAAFCSGMIGCATLQQPWSSAEQRQSAFEAATAAPASTPALALATQPVPAEDARPPVPPTAQRAFDESRRALAAGRIDEAERGFRAMTEAHPELAGPHANLGLIHAQAGRHAEAVAALEQAVRLSPRHATYFNQLGIDYRHIGQFDKAREAYERAIELDPTYAAPLLNLGVLHDLYLWDGKRALELYDRYLALASGGDATVTKWVADLRNRKPQHAALTRQEKP